MNTEQLQEVLRLHSLWLSKDAFGICANLRGADIRKAGNDDMARQATDGS